MVVLQDNQIRLVSINHISDGQISLFKQHVYIPSPTEQSSTVIPPPDAIHPTSVRDNSQLSAVTPYIALSYCWGTQKCSVQFEDHEVDVSSNLVAALRQLHVHFPNRLLWADNLSIDQDDVYEKTCQVGLMGRIFTGAEIVIVWLGDDLDNIYNALNKLVDSGESENAQESSPERVDLIRHLSRIPWFYRAWTFQEIRLANRALVLLGSHLMPWNDFIRKIQLLRKWEPKLSTVTIRSEQQGYNGFTYMPKDRFFAILDELNAGTSGDLAGLLFLTWYRDATERRDKVYSLLSSDLLSLKHHGISIDYKISWSELCIKTARACINTGKNLKVLKIAGMKRRWQSSTTLRWDPSEFNYLLGHPSWAPNWWEPPQQTRAHPSLLFDKRGCFDKLNFCCSDDPPAQDMEDVSPFLTLKGVMLGVLNIGDGGFGHAAAPRIHAPPNCTSHLVQEILQSPTDKNLYIPRVIMPLFVEAMNQHLTSRCSCMPFHERQSQHTDSLFGQSGFGSSLPPLSFSNESFPLFHYSRPNDKSESEFPTQVLNAGVESGDWLVLLEGGGLPFIIRPVTDHMGQVRGLDGLTPMSPRGNLPHDAGLFMIVGEASLCWDQMWPYQWERYCRAGTFVIV